MISAHAILDIPQVSISSLSDAIQAGKFDDSDPGFIPFQQDYWEGWCINGSQLSRFEDDAPVYEVFQGLPDQRMSFPEVSSIAAALHSEICAIRLLRLAPGGVIEFHVDDYEKFGNHDWRVMRKVHVPIISNDLCRNFDQNAAGVFSSFWMKPGEFWFLDGTQRHGACNYGDTDRWHLVMEIVPTAELERLIRPARSSDECSNLSSLLGVLAKDQY